MNVTKKKKKKHFQGLGEQAELKSKIKSGITNIFVSLMQRQRAIHLSCNFFIGDFTNLNGNHQDQRMSPIYLGSNLTFLIFLSSFGRGANISRKDAVK